MNAIRLGIRRKGKGDPKIVNNIQGKRRLGMMRQQHTVDRGAVSDRDSMTVTKVLYLLWDRGME